MDKVYVRKWGILIAFFSILFTVLFGFFLIEKYANTPQDPQKSIGYVVIVFVCILEGILLAIFLSLFFWIIGSYKNYKLLIWKMVSLILVGSFFLYLILVSLQATYAPKKYKRLTQINAGEITKAYMEAKRVNDNRALMAIAANVSTPYEILVLLSDEKELSILQKVAWNESTPIDILEKLSENKSELIRSSITQNPNISIAVLKKLSQDSDEMVRRNAKFNLRKLDKSNVP